ncbi:MAG TPA: hypothetical protein VN947_31670 [Polyangia bacterium]|nr:hypothetical protein [Polyangia bacterium]
MRHVFSGLLIALMAVTGCSSSGGMMGAGGSGGTGGGGSGGTGGGGTGGGGTGGSGGGASDPNVVTIQTQAFDVQPGGEVFMCQDFANPFGGADTEVSQIDSDMTPGSHHMLLFFQPNATDTDVAACDPLQFSTMLYGSQQPHTSLPYPPGVAALIKGTQGFHMQMHYLNATQNVIHAQVTISFTKAMPGTITQHAGVFFFDNISGIHVGAGQTTDVTTSCTFPVAANIMFATAHTHKFTNTFGASIGANMIYQTNQWDNAPNQVYAPAIAVTAGTAISWTCNITNPNASGTLTFGESANTNDMCIFDGQYYPADDNNPNITCMK